jgi:hypothetical protein
MVIARKNGAGGWLIVELMFALTVVVVALIPLAFSFRAEQKLVRAHYNQVVAMEILDGEMEILRAGDWRNLVEGEQPLKVTAKSATNLPPGGFFLMRTGAMMRVEWRPAKKGAGGKIVRETELP